MLLLGAGALLLVDYMQLIIPELYSAVIEGMGTGYVTVGDTQTAFDLTYILDSICRPMLPSVKLFLIAVPFIGNHPDPFSDCRKKVRTYP
jgi:hypothetical protein